MPSEAALTNVVLSLASGSGLATGFPGPNKVASALERAGRTQFERRQCGGCHKVVGMPAVPKKFAKRSDDSVVTVLTKGENEDMKSFKDKLSHSQMVAVAAYIRSFGQKEK